MSSVDVEQVDRKKLIMRMLMSLNSTFPVVVPAYVYFQALISGLNGQEGIWTVMYVLPFISLLSTVGTYVIIRRAVDSAFTVYPGEPANARLSRMLRVPRQIEVGIPAVTMLCIFVLTLVPAIKFGKSLWTIPWCVTVMTLLTTMLGFHNRTVVDRIMRPFSVAEFHKNPEVIPQGSGIFWVRQRWYLPYAFAVFVLCTIATVTTILVRQGYDNYLALRQQVASSELSAAQFLPLLDATGVKIVRDVSLPIGVLVSYLLVVAAVSAWQLSRYQTEGALSVQRTVEALASCDPKLPEWVSTDEIGDLASATAKAFGRLKAFSTSLGESAHALRRSAEQLGLSTGKQTEALTHQATALQETQVTAQEIKQTSSLTAQKAENILQQTEKADEIGRAGAAAIQQSLSGLQEIGEQVKEMARQIRNLDQRTRQIASITTTVKDLADQSNMLALNAAIEAVRSGEHGKGFGVVAREIRTLADQSIRATNSVRSILQDISTAIRTTVSMTEKGSEKVESSLVQVREFGNNISELSGIVRENAASVRQITAAVTQQNTGITQIFQAVNDLSRLMDQTMVQLRTSDEALELVRNVTDKVAAMSGEKAAPAIAASVLSKPS
ncbi:methyl-accepting chemotaxis protein [Archangium gephyra]|uniref:Methyl-accepting chemotaxis protein n=1 Tax=Archangium gephyra TaxID=48 RepID=A0AAC8TE62_9BACT|nr:methyl-accepting chemotaxis protein [Archangium gephyra]AKJ02533.1 methyl-accepting chemotaxis protein [Archangium gephyra]